MNRRNIVTNLATLAVSLLVTVFVVEFGLSFYKGSPMERILPEVKYDDHPIRWYSLRPDQEGYTFGAPFTVDKAGFRSNGGDDFTRPSRKVVALGDSFTFGMGVADNQTWPARLETKLNAKEPGAYRVLNAGIVGYNAFQLDELVKDKSQLVDARLVVYALYWNDYLTTAPPGPNDKPRISEKGYFRWDPVNRLDSNAFSLRRWLVDHSFILSTLRDLRNSSGGPNPYGKEFERLIQGKLTENDFSPIGSFLDDMQERGKEYGFQFVVVILPVYDLMGTGSGYDEIIRAMLKKRGIAYFDAFSVFDRMAAPGDYFLPERIDVHLNPGGYEVLAEGLYQTLLSSNLTP